VKTKKDEFGIFLGLCAIFDGILGYVVAVFLSRKLGVGIVFLSWISMVTGMVVHSKIMKNKRNGETSKSK